ncbi:hypothetical protein [uncultured Marixanthomonas sp.]|uniref:hypothetical protein n=1 Tax=uncultured Marixanthomonas sp. TaxID=757245 RepID=UPI0030D7741C|tara:strand:+ start:1325 stop:1702 length:378 start_codon:yes stop_codon:yes gene_type:complete
MITKLTYHFGIAEIHENYIIFEMNEGITVKPEYNDILLNVATKYYVNKNFGYITKRVNSYSVDPRVYFETSKIENLVAFAVVSPEDIKASTTEVEKIFLKKPFQHFKTMKEATGWINSIVEKSTV